MPTYDRTKKEDATVPDDPQARELLRKAFENTYRWPKEFTGFAAELEVGDSGKMVRGEVKVRPPGDVSLSLPDEGMAEWAKGQIGMQVIHLRYRTFDEADGRFVLTLAEEDEHPMGRLVLIHGDGMQSRYRVRNARIAQITRTMGPMRFTINIEDSITLPDGRQMSGRYSVYYFNAQDGVLKQAETFSDWPEEIRGLYLPGRRRILSAEGGEVRVRTLLFSEHRLL